MQFSLRTMLGTVTVVAIGMALSVELWRMIQFENREIPIHYTAVLRARDGAEFSFTAPLPVASRFKFIVGREIKRNPPDHLSSSELEWVQSFEREIPISVQQLQACGGKVVVQYDLNSFTVCGMNLAGQEEFRNVIDFPAPLHDNARAKSFDFYLVRGLPNSTPGASVSCITPLFPDGYCGEIMHHRRTFMLSPEERNYVYAYLRFGVEE